MSKLNRMLRAGCVAIAMLVATQANAGLLFYTTEAAFTGASTTSVINFEGIVTSSGAQNFAPYTNGGVTFSRTDGGVVTVCGSSVACQGGPFDSALLAPGNGSPLRINIAGGTTTAAGGIFGDIDGAGSSAIFSVFGAGNLLLGTYSVTVGDMGQGLSHTFFGWTATGGDVITSIEYDMSGTFEAVDNFRHGSAGVVNVPEPAPVALLGMGLLGLCISRRRKA